MHQVCSAEKCSGFELMLNLRDKKKSLKNNNKKRIEKVVGFPHSKGKKN